jgi:hypothetical protein
MFIPNTALIFKQFRNLVIITTLTSVIIKSGSNLTSNSVIVINSPAYHNGQFNQAPASLSHRDAVAFKS